MYKFLIFAMKNAKNVNLTSIGNVCGAHDPTNLFHGLKVGTKAAMTAKYFLINDSCDG